MYTADLSTCVIWRMEAFFLSQLTEGSLLKSGDSVKTYKYYNKSKKISCLIMPICSTAVECHNLLRVVSRNRQAG